MNTFTKSLLTTASFLLIGALATTVEAQTTPPATSCVNFTKPSGSWPLVSQTLECSGSGIPVHTKLMREALVSITDSPLTASFDAAAQLKAYTVTFREFQNPADYHNLVAPPPFSAIDGLNDVSGHTSYGSSPSSAAVSIFETSVDVTPTKTTVDKNQIIAYATAHEIGHILDHIYGNSLIGGALFSSGTTWKAYLDVDEAGLNATAPNCNSFGRDQNGNQGPVGGRFGGVKDSKLAYMCGSDGNGPSLNSPYDAQGGNGLKIVGKAWPRYNTKIKGVDDPNFVTELFANAAAIGLDFNDVGNNSGNNRTTGVNSPGIAYFPCVEYLTRFVEINGREPNPSESKYWNAYSIPDGGPGNYGPGVTTYYCDGSAPVHTLYNFGN